MSRDGVKLRERRVGAVTTLRGFSLVELLFVIAIISASAVIARPVFSKMMQDRRVNRAAMRFVDIYGTARARAMGRGIPELVRWDVTKGNKAGASGLIAMIEPAATQSTTVPTCAGNDWTSTTNNQTYMQFDLGNGMYELATIAFTDDTGHAQANSEICFAPGGRSYIRTIGGTFTAFNGVPKFSVTNDASKGGTGLVRTVVIPPNGVARIGQ